MDTAESVFCELQKAFDEFAVLYRAVSKTDQPLSISDALNRVLTILQNDLKYSARDLAFALDIEPLTVLRWRNGSNSAKPMKPETFNTFTNFIKETVNERPQRPIRISDTGIFSWKYVFRLRQREAKRMWMISEGNFILASSRTVRDNALDIFSANEQIRRAAGKPSGERIIPSSIYIFPAGSKTEESLKAWIELLHTIKDERNLRGMVLGIRIEDTTLLPWFLPGQRVALMHIKEGDRLEGYMRFQLPFQNEQALFAALGVTEDQDDQTPWMIVHSKVADPWFFEIERQFLKIVKQAEGKVDDGFHGEIISYPLTER